MRSLKKPVPLPLEYYIVPMVLLALVGLGDSVYLSISHYRNYTDIGYSSFCAISQSINCDTVSQSPYSIFMGVPVPVWGVLGYGMLLFLLGLAWQHRNALMPLWSLLFIIALGFALYSVVLALISAYYIRSYCIMCILSYAINLLLLFYAWIVRRRFELPALAAGMRQDFLWCLRNRWMRGVALASVPVILGAMLFFPNYWHYPSDLPITNIPTGLTNDGNPWIGAEHPEIEIVEYTDYLCFQCRKMHYFLRKLVARYPDRIRLIHKHFPMDNEVNAIVKQPFHVGSGRLAVIALYAAQQNKFWEVNDRLFEIGGKKEQIDLARFAKEFDMDPEGLRKSLTTRTDLHMALAKDIWDGIKLKITGTPAYCIEGQVYLAQVPAEVLRRVMR